MSAVGENGTHILLNDNIQCTSLDQLSFEKRRQMAHSLTIRTSLGDLRLQSRDVAANCFQRNSSVHEFVHGHTENREKPIGLKPRAHHAHSAGGTKHERPRQLPSHDDIRLNNLPPVCAFRETIPVVNDNFRATVRHNRIHQAIRCQ